jgi:catechol-2,3-dioxygenase
VYFEDPDGLVVEVYSTEIEMIETNRRLLLDRL